MKQKRIALISSVPYTLHVFYSDLIQALVDEGCDVHICSSPGEAMDTLSSKSDLSTHEIPILRKISPWTDLLAIRLLINAMKQNKIQIVHTHTPKAGLLGMLSAFLARVPVRFHTCHGLPAETERGFKRWLLLSCEKLTCKLANKVLVVSHSLSKKMTQANLCDPSKMKILGDGTACGVNLQRFTKTAELQGESIQLLPKIGLKETDFVIGFVGRLVPDKGIHVLVEAFEDISEDYPNARLLIIGDYEEHRGALSEQIKHAINNNPEIVHVDYTDQIEKYYAIMNMLVLPTRREGFPYTLLEAAAMEIPVIATNVTGCVDAVVDQTTGLLVEPDNPHELKQAMCTLIGNAAMREKMARAARERVEKYYFLERYIQLHLKLYSEIN
ncbi:MAG: glycosyltransferase family 4 protein [Nitrospinales bacterium]